ncbi:MAG: nuclear transport factor 2 family protein [Candidatus Brevundimonas colombiensis]|uniref:Nuclear transport factor 2 family protein n=1 Tax=Candidatus Brevundimonas colombiensis TaxID=3121376 RepID=A0AAJ5X1C5_9CAUL|nr:nuclear transport factor 2 family protein [Brevundimonas sp.]WEK39253.1 MAG: nuclear transport factor 2 family protein [Brevundimonas sp.]
MLTALIAALALSQSATAAPTAEAQVASVLDRLNQASSTADEATYFSLFAPDARFVGTDANEHWTMAQFRAFAEPWFKKDTAWSFPATSRAITIAPIDCRCIAWFEEKLASPSYGETRGSGVMRLTDDGWKIEQYVLSFAVPNDRADAVVAAIKGEAASAH